MTTANKRRANEQRQKAQQAGGMLTPPQIVAGLRVIRTIGEDIEFGRCNHALQLLPNQVILLLVTEETEGGGSKTSTFLLGEEIPGFEAEKSLIETPDAAD